MSVHDVLVIGAGQAGLAIGYHLRAAGLDFLLLDGAARIGDSWRDRYDSLVLFTPARRNALPGSSFPAPPSHYPSKDEVAGYLEEYARTHRLPVRTGVRVSSLARAEGEYTALTDRGPLRARQVVIATGPFGVPSAPPIADGLSVPQWHSSAYRRPEQLPEGRVLVAGSGNSGAQIAAELSTSRDVTVAQGARQPVVPQHLLGHDVFDWAEWFGILNVPITTRLGRWLSRRDPLIGTNLRALERRGRLKLKPRAVGAAGNTVAFQDSSTTEFDAVIWATGYRPDYRWVHLPVLDAAGRPLHSRGRTAAPGLYFLGLPWQTTRGSALLGGVGGDAAFIAEHIIERHRNQERPAAPPA